MSDDWDIPAPCCIISTCKSVCTITVIVVFISYILKAAYMMNSNNETFFQTLLHLRFWAWDVAFFVYAILLVSTIYFSVIAFSVAVRVIRRCYQLDSTTEQHRHSLGSAQTRDNGYWTELRDV